MKGSRYEVAPSPAEIKEKNRENKDLMKNSRFSIAPRVGLNQRKEPGKQRFDEKFLVRIASSPAETKEINRENKDLMKNSRYELLLPRLKPPK